MVDAGYVGASYDAFRATSSVSGFAPSYPTTLLFKSSSGGNLKLFESVLE